MRRGRDAHQETPRGASTPKRHAGSGRGGLAIHIPFTMAEENITVRMQAWVYFVTWVQYAANHITRKCYTNVSSCVWQPLLPRRAPRSPKRAASTRVEAASTCVGDETSKTRA